ncbi:MAG: hypothetical protein ACLQVY_23285, partial [Limisphaerales bacterium]
LKRPGKRRNEIGSVKGPNHRVSKADIDVTRWLSMAQLRFVFIDSPTPRCSIRGWRQRWP